MEPQEIRQKYQQLLKQYHAGEIDWKTFESGLMEMKHARAALKAGWNGTHEEMEDIPGSDIIRQALDQRKNQTQIPPPGHRKAVFSMDPPPGSGQWRSGLNRSDEHNTSPGSSGLHRENSSVFFRNAGSRSLHLQPGDVLGESYTLERPLGHGVLGETWKAYNRTTDRSVVLKLIPKEIQKDPDRLAVVRTAFRNSSQLRGPNICPLYRIGLDEEFGLYLVSAYLDAVSLGEYHTQYMAMFQSFPVHAVIRTLWPVGKSLDHAHGRKVLHRGLKLQNILIGKRCGVQVTDFAVPEITRNCLIALTGPSHDLPEVAPFLAPEVWDRAEYSPKSDQYALAVVTYRLLSGRLPFFAKSEEELRRMVELTDLLPIEGQPDAVNSALLRAMDKAPAKRFDSCLHFLKELVEPTIPGPHSSASKRSGSQWAFLPLLFGFPAVGMPKGLGTDADLWPFKETPLTTRSSRTDILQGHSYPYNNMTGRGWLALGGGACAAVAAVGLAAFFGLASGNSPTGKPTPDQVASRQASSLSEDASPLPRISIVAPLPTDANDGSAASTFDGPVQRIAENDVPKVGETISGKSMAHLLAEAEDGDVLKQRQLGEMYLLGKGVGKDYAEAVRWFRKASTAGDLLSIFRVGYCYEFGFGVPRNEKTAVEWYLKGAAQHEPLSLYRLGLCYKTGTGTARNLEKAKEAFREAVSHGHGKAKQELDELVGHSAEF